MTEDEREGLKALARWRRERGRYVPKPCRDAETELCPTALDYWQAFTDLAGSVGRGFDREPIKMDDARAWLELHAIASWRWASFWRVVHQLDFRHREMLRQKDQQEAPA